MRMAAVCLIVMCVLGSACEDRSNNSAVRRELMNERNQLQAILNQNKTPPAQMTPEQLAYYGKIDREIREIDRQIDDLDHPVPAD